MLCMEEKVCSCRKITGGEAVGTIDAFQLCASQSITFTIRIHFAKGHGLIFQQLPLAVLGNVEVNHAGWQLRFRAGGDDILCYAFLDQLFQVQDCSISRFPLIDAEVHASYHKV